MGNRLEGKVAVVTGAGRGVGRGVALLMAEEGAKVVVNDLGADVDGTGGSQAPADNVVAEIAARGGEAVANYDDMALMEGGEALIQQAVDAYDRSTPGQLRRHPARPHDMADDAGTTGTA